MAHENKIYMQKYCLRGFWEGGRTGSTRNVFLEKPARSLSSRHWGRGYKRPNPPNTSSCTSDHHDDHRRDKQQLAI